MFLQKYLNNFLPAFCWSKSQTLFVPMSFESFHYCCTTILSCWRPCFQQIASWFLWSIRCALERLQETTQCMMNTYYIYTLIWIIYTFQWILFGYGFGLDKFKVSPEEAPGWQGGITGCCSTLLNNPIDVAWHQKSSPCNGGSSQKKFFWCENYFTRRFCII